jgi:hypothetical protein
MTTPANNDVGQLISEMTMGQLTPINVPRAVLSQSMSFQVPGEDGTSYHFPGNLIKFSTPERPYDRAATITQTPFVLEFGYLGDLDKIGMVYFHNMTGRGHSSVPTEEQRQADALAVILIEELQVMIPPRFAFPIIPSPSLTKLTVRSLGGPARLRWIGVGK